MPSRRTFISGIAIGSVLTAGCLGSREMVARCSSRGVGSGSQYLRGVAPLGGEDEIALGVMVSRGVPGNERFHAIDVRDRDGGLVASIPLMNNRAMNRLDPEDYPVLGSEEGELYAVPLGPPPVHGDFQVSLVDAAGETVAVAEIRFNCYSSDGSLP